MSKDFRPIDHILSNIELKRAGLSNDYMFEHPYIEMTNVETNEKIALNDKECCEKFPYVSFFIDDLNKCYQEKKNDATYIVEMITLETQLKEVVKRIEGRIGTSKVLNLDGIFNDLPFSDHDYNLADFIMADGDYAFSYDCSMVLEKFAKNFHKISKEMAKKNDADPAFKSSKELLKEERQ